MAAAAVVATVGFVGATDVARAETAGIDGGTLVIAASPGESNVLLIEPAGPNAYLISDDGAQISPGIGCAPVTSNAARCTGLIVGVSVDSGDGDDLVGAWDVGRPVKVDGGPGNDLVVTGPGSDQLTGDDGLDTIDSGSGDDRVSGGDGGDLLRGGAGADTLLGGPGDDIAQGDAGSGDVVSGGPGDDLVSGGPGNDTVNGDAGDDALASGGGTDTISTGAGEDRVYLAKGSSSTVDCRAGDRVRRPGAAPPLSCTALPAKARLPTGWPPVTSTPQARAATIRPSSPGVATKVWLRGHVRRVAVRVDKPNSKPAVVLMRAYDRGHHRLRSFHRTVRTRNWDEFVGPPPPAGTWIMRADCCSGGF